jgi:hypothetical protein
MGDVQYLTGEVVGKRQEDGGCFVDLMVHATNQRGTVTAICEASVILPSREFGPVVLPEPPREEKVKATNMWKRHNELLAERGFKRYLD